MEEEIISLELAKRRTKLSNQRTYLSYIRTLLAIIGIASIFKKMYILYTGIIVIILVSIQYLSINNMIDNNKYFHGKIFDYYPIGFVLLLLLSFYFEIR